MNSFNRTIIVTLLVSISFVVGNLTSESFDIKSTLDRMSKKKVVSSGIKQNIQVPVKNINQLPIRNVQQLSQTLIKKIGESYTLSNMEYKVISAVNKGTKYEYQTTTGKFIFVKILVSNIGKINSKGSLLIIKDKNDRQFSQKENFYFAYNSGLKQYYFNMFDDGMAPGFSETYTAVFEVAKDSTDLKLCHPSTTGTDIVCVQLGL